MSRSKFIMNAAVIEQHAEEQNNVHQIVLYNDT